jgi:hypothetical protein
MTDETSNEYMMIGLHKLAADRDDGLVPELMALYAERRRMAMQVSNVVAFPEELASPASAHPLGLVGNDNVIVFTPHLAQKARRR